MSRYIQGSLIIVFSLFVATASQAQFHNLSKGFVILNEQLTTNVFYDTDFATGNPDFTNEVAHIMEKGSLLLGGEVTTSRYNIDANEGAADNAAMFYNLNGSLFISLDLPSLSSNPDVWQEQDFSDMVEFGKTLPVGIHTVCVFFSATDVNPPPPVGGPITRTLPTSGTYKATIRVSPRAPDLIACDSAKDQAYGDGWQHDDNGGFGFKPWTMLTNFVGDGDAAGFFTSSNPPNTDVNFILTHNKAWGMFANESGSGGDDIQIAGAFRSFNQALQVGQTVSIDIEHSGIQSGSLSANSPPRTGGWVGFALRSQPPTLQGDPDPFNAFGTLQNAVFAFGFRGGNAFYHAYDVVQPTSGITTDVPFTTNGVQVRFTLTDTNAYSLRITSKGPGAFSTNFSSTLSSGSISNIVLYNRNAEEGDAHFNNLYIFDAPVTNKQAYDDAADAAYTSGWTNGTDGGFGFEPWSIFSTNGAGGAGGTFTAIQPGNADLNFIATSSKAWGMFANDSGGGGVQTVNGFRSFTDGELSAGQSFSIDVEHGGVAALNGEINIILVGTARQGGPFQGEVYLYTFRGGESNYMYTDDTGTTVTDIPFSSDGFRLTYTQLSNTEPYTYVVKIESFGGIAGVRYFLGYVDTIPKALKVKITDVEDADVFINDLCIAGEPSIEEIIISLFRINGTYAEIGFESDAGQRYRIRRKPDLLNGEWDEILSLSDIPSTGGLLVVSNLVQGTIEFYQAGISTNTP